MFGLIGWARRQKVTDRTEDLEQIRAEAEISQLTETERIKRAQQDAAQDMLDDVVPEPVHDFQEQGQGSGPVPGSSPTYGSPPDSGVSDGQSDPRNFANDYPDCEYSQEEESRAENILLAEYALADKLTKGFPERHTGPTPRIDVSGNRLYANGLVMPVNSKDGYVVTLKVVSGDGTRRTEKARVRANELAAMLETPTAGGKFKPVTVIVYRDGRPPIKVSRRDADGVRTLIFGFDDFLRTSGPKLREMIEAS